MIRKQDKTHVRTPSALERKYRFDKNFTETKQAGAQAQKAAEQAQTAANDASSQLANKLGRDEKEQVVDMVNTSGKAVTAEFDQEGGEYRAHIVGGVISVTSPQEVISGDGTEKCVLLMKFNVGNKVFGFYAFGIQAIDEETSEVYWSPTGEIIIQEITE